MNKNELQVKVLDNANVGLVISGKVCYRRESEEQDILLPTNVLNTEKRR